MEILYARSQNGKIKIWSINGNMDNTITITSGYIGSKPVISTRSCTFASMEKELQSRIREQKRNGYKSLSDLNINPNYTNVENLNLILDKTLPKTNLDLDFNLKPNKAVKFRDRQPIYPCYGQPKINGLRGTIRMESISNGIGLFNTGKINTIVIKTMGGLEYIMPSITKDTNILDYDGIQLALDGELYIPYTPLNIIKRAIPMRLENGTITSVSRPDLTKEVKFYCFDLAIEDVEQQERLVIRDKFLSFVNAIHQTSIISVPTKLINNKEEAILFANECVANGFEGAVFRDIYANYKFGSKTKDMIKLKFFDDAEFMIVDVIPKDKEPELGMFICKNDINDETFTVNPMGDHNKQKEYLSNKYNYIGRMVTVKFYERSGIKSVPFHANALEFRDYE